MELLYDEHGLARVEKGNPVYRTEDGQEMSFDARAAVEKIQALASEAETHRMRVEELLARLAAVEDIEDLPGFRDAAGKALEKARLLDSGAWLPREEADRIREEALLAVREELRTMAREKARYKALAVREAVTGVFDRSEFLRRRVNLPAEAVKALLKGHFRLVDGRVLAYDGGNLLYGGKGEPAQPEEALEILLSTRFPDPTDVRVWKASGGGGADSGKTLPRSSLSLTPQQARDPRQYRRGRDEASRTGRPLVVSG